MIINDKCKMCGAKLPTTSNLFCAECIKKRNAISQMRSYYRKKELKKTKGEKNILLLKAMLEGVDLTPYMPKPEDQELSEAQDE